MSDNMPVCADCVFSREQGGGYLGCSHDGASRQDVVRGGLLCLECSSVRANDDACGHRAKWFQPRQPKQPRVSWWKRRTTK